MKTQAVRDFLVQVLLPMILLVLIAAPGFRDILKPGHFTSHDGEGHIIRMDEFYRSFTEGHFPVRWSKRLYYGYGFPFFNFNYPSVYYLGLPVMLAGFSATAAIETEMIVTYVLSGIFMYLYLRRKVAIPLALSGAVLYLYAPYRLLNIYVRGSVAESATFMLAPLLMWGIEAIAADKKNSLVLTALALFVLGISHNISALLLFAFFLGYSSFISVAKKSIWPLIKSGIAFGLGLMMSAFFFVPALVEKKLTWLDFTIAKDYPDHFLYLTQLIKGGWDFGNSTAGPEDGLSFNLGWLHLGLALVAISSYLIFSAKIKKKFSPTFIYSLVVLIVAILFMFPVTRPLWDNLPLLPFVQFPWRFIMLTVPALTIISVLGLHYLSQTWNWSGVTQTAVLGLITIGTLFLAKDMWHSNQPLYAQYRPGDAIEGTTTWANEQATQWLDPRPTAIPGQKVQALDGEVEVKINKWLAHRHEYVIKADEAATVVEETMYYPGWQVWIDGRETELNYRHPDASGKIVFVVPAGEHQVMAKLTETPMRLAVDILSAATLAGVLGYLVIANLFAPKFKIDKWLKKFQLN